MISPIDLSSNLEKFVAHYDFIAIKES